MRIEIRSAPAKQNLQGKGLNNQHLSCAPHIRRAATAPETLLRVTFHARRLRSVLTCAWQSELDRKIGS